MKMHPMVEKQFGRLFLHGIGTAPVSPMSIANDIPAMPLVGAAAAVGMDCPRPAHRNAARTNIMNQRWIGPGIT